MKLRGTSGRKRKGEYKIVKRQGRIYVLKLKRNKIYENE